jgi:PleD family two-component response regulator
LPSRCTAPVTISAGVSTLVPELGGAAFVLIAPAALYEAKRGGRNRVK